MANRHHGLTDDCVAFVRFCCTFMVLGCDSCSLVWNDCLDHQTKNRLMFHGVGREDIQCDSWRHLLFLFLQYQGSIHHYFLLLIQNICNSCFNIFTDRKDIHDNEL